MFVQHTEVKVSSCTTVISYVKVKEGLVKFM